MTSLTSRLGDFLGDLLDPARDSLSPELADLPEAACVAVADLTKEGNYALRAGLVRKRVGEDTLRMFAYNGSVPGPTLRVMQGSELTIDFSNETDVATTVHWHGLRLDYRFDGVPENAHHRTQSPVPPGGAFRYRVRFPDPGIYWYHPHLREDYAQEHGLYGGIVVVPTESLYWSPANREIVLVLDDILVEDGRVAAFREDAPDHTLMGRFGNVMLTNGETALGLTASLGEVIRFYLINAANSRVFCMRLPGARMKLVGSDSGRVEFEEMIDHVLLAPSERAVVDVMFDQPGELTLEHQTPSTTTVLGQVQVATQPVERSYADEFATLRRSDELYSERSRLAPELSRAPDRILALVGDMEGHGAHGTAGAPAGRRPHRDHGGHELAHSPRPGAHSLHNAKLDDHAGSRRPQRAGIEPGGLEWEDTMPDLNRLSSPSTMHWKLIDRETGAANQDIRWSFRVGERAKIQIVNEMASDHPMQHPIHFHGQRFLVLARDGVPNQNLAWKDTVLLKTGESVDILLEASNPGTWMVHCHIAEHLEGGMMFTFQVA